MSDGQWIESATLDLWEGRHREQLTRIEELEAKLAKAVDALQAFNSFDDLPVEARTPDIFQRNVRMPILRTLAALKGQGDE